MKYYFAARYRRRYELRNHRDELEALGLGTVTATWIDENGEARDFESEAAPRARRDLADIDAADALVLFGVPGHRAGSMYEAGYAAGKRKRVILIGRRSNVFTFNIAEHYPTWSSFIASLTQEAAA